MLSALDAAIVIAFLAYAAASGFRSRKISSQNLEEYFLAGRSLPGWKAGMSMAATQFAADTPLLVVGMIATAGIFSLWRLWIYAIAFLLMGFLFAGPWRRARVLTDAELAELRYGGRLGVVLRAAKAIYFGTIFNCTVMAMVLLAATRIAEPFLRWHAWLPGWMFDPAAAFVRAAGLSLTMSESEPWIRSADNLLSLVAVLAVTTLYSTTGGLRAVVRTDVMQFAIAMTATAAYAVVIVDRAGGLPQMTEQLRSLYGTGRANALLAFDPMTAPDITWMLLATIGIQWLAQMNADGTGYLAQRSMACRSDRDARHAAIIFAVAQVLIRSLLWIAIGLGLLVLYPMVSLGAAPGLVAEREAMFVYGLDTHLPSGFKGLMLAGMLAALASTLDTHLNWGSSYWTNDLYRRVLFQGWLRREPSPRSLVVVARVSNLLIVLIAAVILTQLSSIQAAWKISLLLGAGMGVPLVLRWIWWRVSAATELAAIAVSTALAPILLATVQADGARMLVLTSITTLVAIAVSLAGPATPSEHVRRFYRRVRPPGFWGPVARLEGDDPTLPARRLWLGLGATAAGSLALFCALVGLGTWLFDSPSPLPSIPRCLWIAGLFVATGACLVLVLRIQRRRVALGGR